jgi:hypothetical protein
MYLKATAIIFTAIMLATPAKAIARLSQYVVSIDIYCVSPASSSVDKITRRNALTHTCINEQSIKMSLLQHLKKQIQG